MFPLPSVAVNTTVFAPTLAHVNVNGVAAIETEQLSEEPPSTSAATIPAFPEASNCTVMFWHTATGPTLSSTVTVAVQVDTFPFISPTESVTVLAPISVQFIAAGFTNMPLMPQASEDPLSTSPGTIIYVPAALNCTVAFWHRAVGSTLSSTVTVALQLSVFPLPSVAVSTTVLAPTLAHVKPNGVAEILTEQLSDEPLSTSAATMLALPVASNCTAIF